MDIKHDKLTQDILRFIREQEGNKVVATYVVSRLYNSPSADSNHRGYRRVLSRLNWLKTEGYIKGHSPNRHTPTRWWAELTPGDGQ